MVKKAVQFGAGNIGRGFLGQLFSESGYEVVFVEINPQLISLLNQRRSYPLRIAAQPLREVIVKDVRAVDGRDIEKVRDEVAGAEIVGVAVGVNALREVIPALTSGICRRADLGREEPLNIIIAENLPDAGKVVKGMVLEASDPKYHPYIKTRVGFVETVIARMVPVMPEELRKEDALLLLVEEYRELPVNKKGFVGTIPIIKNMYPVDNFTAFAERKFYLHNASHAVTAYLGYLRGYEYIWQAIGDSEIWTVVRGAMNEAKQALIVRHGMDGQKLEEHIQDILRRYTNVALGDTIERVAKDPLRKLSPQDRLIGAARMVENYGIIPENLSWGIAAALKYDSPGDKEAQLLQAKLQEKGLERVLQEVCSVNPGEPLAEMIKDKFLRLEDWVREGA